MSPQSTLPGATSDLESGSPHGTDGAPETKLLHAIAHGAHLLPAQGPITAFIHHNTLHAFEEIPFHEAVKAGAKVFGCQAYMTEDQFRERLRNGRIREADLRAVLEEDMGGRAQEKIFWLGTRLDFRLAMLQYPNVTGTPEELLWFVSETDALRRVRKDVSAAVRSKLVSETRRWVMRDLRGGNESRENFNRRSANPSRLRTDLTYLIDRFGASRIEDWADETWEAFTLQALWRVCRDGIAALPVESQPVSTHGRHRDLLLQASGADTDLLVHALLIPFCAAFLDQGVAQWELPGREQGFYQAFCKLYGRPAGPPDRWLRGLRKELARLEAENVTPLECIRESLGLLGVKPEEWDSFLSKTLLALPGWAGMIRQIEERGDRVARQIPQNSLLEFLAIRLLLDRLALTCLAKEHLGFLGQLNALRVVASERIGTLETHGPRQRAIQVFQLAQVMGWTPAVLKKLDPGAWATLLGDIEEFSGLERRRIFQLAYERRFANQSLDALALRKANFEQKRTPRFQATFCIDDREESIRRHLEEIAPDVETFGAAAFFGVAVYYKGTADAHFAPLCPIVIRPSHWVVEQVVGDQADAHARRARARRFLGTLSHRLHAGSRTFILGAILTLCLGVFAAIPLVARILFPRLTSRIRQRFARAVEAPPATRLQLERTEPEPGPTNGHLGYSISEMAAIGENQLRDIGLTRNFARLVLFCGHGSSSMNNPHRSAYDCGACGGAPGAPNGRALAQMLNDGRVRQRLADRGLVIPPETVFVGGYHNTCDDSMRYFDEDCLPETHREEFERLRRDFQEACARNAHERCRRFMSAPLTLSFSGAHQHAEGRAADLAQTRPELGHATNALCVVGRRERTRGLFLDRRVFLTSYDPTQDDDLATILGRLLGAAVPVCAGISLEYYFSRVDSTGWGCGTKLPHNVTSLLGVMDGAASDLRTGLPWQMVEIHEPVRILFILETTEDRIRAIMGRSAEIGRHFRNGWALLALQHPGTGELSLFKNGKFEPYVAEASELPSAATSVDWYRGWRGHLEFAEIGI